VGLQVKEVLAHIEAGSLLPPLVVLQALAQNPQLKLSVVKAYVARTLAAEGAVVDEDRKLIARFQDETAAMRAEIQELKTKVHGRSSATPCTNDMAPGCRLCSWDVGHCRVRRYPPSQLQIYC
jgi:hypothetical protein